MGHLQEDPIQHIDSKEPRSRSKPTHVVDVKPMVAHYAPIKHMILHHRVLMKHQRLKHLRSKQLRHWSWQWWWWRRNLVMHHSV